MGGAGLLTCGWGEGTDLSWEDYAMSDGVTFSSIPLFRNKYL